MLVKKIRVTLQPGAPYHFNSISPMYQGGSLTLKSFKVESGRVEWFIETNRGHLIEGRAKGEREIPLWPGSWITLAIPLKIHVRDSGNAPEFIVCIPGSIIEKQ